MKNVWKIMMKKVAKDISLKLMLSIPRSYTNCTWICCSYPKDTKKTQRKP